MDVKVENQEEGKVKFHNQGGGTHRLKNGKKVKPNEVFWSHPSNIPECAKHVIKPTQDIPEKPIEGKSEYEVRHKGAGWYDVYRVGTDKPINEKSLRQDGANELMARLTGE